MKMSLVLDYNVHILALSKSEALATYDTKAGDDDYRSFPRRLMGLYGNYATPEREGGVNSSEVKREGEGF